MRSPHAAVSEDYMELNEAPMAKKDNSMGKINNMGAPRVWTDEVIFDDEEKVASAR